MEATPDRIEEATTTESQSSEETQSNELLIPPTGINLEDVRLKVLTHPDKRLKEKSIEVSEEDFQSPEFLDYLKLLVHTMYIEGGVGLAAPQVGWGHRIVAIDCNWNGDEKEKDPTILINPTLHDLNGEQEIEEACLSVIGPSAKVKRYYDCVLKFKDHNWEDQEIYLSSFDAAVAQHEVDHLDGILYIDKLSRLQKDIWNRKRKKILRRARKQNLYN